MRAVVLRALGEPEELGVEDVPAPVPGEGQVLVDVKASALNFVEVLVRRGLYPQMPELPWVPGAEIAGVTADGRRVLGLLGPGGGGYAEQAVLDEAMCFDLPDGATFEEGAAFLLAYLTAWIPLTRQAIIHPGMRVLVHAAAGGVGSAAVVVAGDLGADVVATADPRRSSRCPGHSAPPRLSRTTGSRRSTPSTSSTTRSEASSWPTRSRSCGRSESRSRSASPAAPGSSSIRRCSWGGTSACRASTSAASRASNRSWSRGGARSPPALERPSRAPVVGATFPFEEAAEAHRLMESRNSTGKVILVP